MAPNNEELDEQVGGQSSSKKGGSMLIVILLVLNLLLVGALGAYFVLFVAPPNGGDKKSADSEDGQNGQDGDEAKAVEEGMGPMIALDPFLINLDEPGSNRYLKAVIQLEADNTEAVKEIEDRKIPIKDLIITYLSSLTYAQTQGVGNKDIIRITLVKQINNKLGKGKVRKLYFTEFVIQ